MENFFNYVTKHIPKEEVLIWFNVNNMNFEKIELFGDFFKSLNETILDTYFGEESQETKIILSEEDKSKHFDWCWKKVIDSFKKENLVFKSEGQHKDYFKSFFSETFYHQKDKNIKNSIPTFLIEVFDIEKPFSKSDLDLLTELYKLLERNLEI